MIRMIIFFNITKTIAIIKEKKIIIIHKIALKETHCSKNGTWKTL